MYQHCSHSLLRPCVSGVRGPARLVRSRLDPGLEPECGGLRVIIHDSYVEGLSLTPSRPSLCVSRSTDLGPAWMLQVFPALAKKCIGFGDS